MSLLAWTTSGATIPKPAADSGGSRFPTPLHIVRRIDDALSRTSTIVEEFCDGNRIVSVSGHRVAVADFARREVTEIDRDRRTWSLSSFDDIAAARGATKTHGAAPAVRLEGSKLLSSRGRTLETWELARGATRRRVGIDRSIPISRSALAALSGRIDSGSDDDAASIMDVAAPAARSLDGACGLPTVESIERDGQLLFTSQIIAVDHVRVAAGMIAIGNTDRRVPSGATTHRDPSVDGSRLTRRK